MIYLDNSATTKPDMSVIKSFQQVSERYYGNPSSIHGMGAEVEKLQEKARQQAASLLQINDTEVTFTSGGTEGNNLAIKGIAFRYAQRGKHIITTEIEHASVYETCKNLEEFGYTVTYLPVDDSGHIQVEQLEAAITEDTILVSIMHVNNETGAIQPIADIGYLLKKHPKIFFHVDAVQSLGKVPFTLSNSGIDLCTFSGHKIHGLKGTGMLYIRDGIQLTPLFHGGNQERALRSGTENVAGNVSFVRALRLIKEKEQTEMKQLKQHHQFVIEELSKRNDIQVNSTVDGAPHIINISVPGYKSETIIHALYEKGAVLSTQSACSSKQSDVSRVLKAYGLTDEAAKAGLRVSMSFETSKSELEQFVVIFDEVIQQLKQVME